MHFESIALTLSSGLAFCLFVRTVYIIFCTPRLLPTRDVHSATADVLVPVRNEMGRGLETNLTALLHQFNVVQIIITDDRSTDGSAELIQRLCQSSNGHMVYVKGVETPPGWLGKTFALEQAKNHSTSKWIGLIDADVLANPDLLAIMDP